MRCPDWAVSTDNGKHVAPAAPTCHYADKGNLPIAGAVVTDVRRRVATGWHCFSALQRAVSMIPDSRHDRVRVFSRHELGRMFGGRIAGYWGCGVGQEGNVGTVVHLLHSLMRMRACAYLRYHGAAVLAAT